MPERLHKGPGNKWGRAAGVTDISTGRFYNPYFMGRASPELRRDLYRDWITKNDSERAKSAREGLPRLRGRHLACTCPPRQACHGDVLLELANAGGGE